MPDDAGAPRAHHKDAILDQLAQHANVAQFVSFSPALEQRFAHVHGFVANHRFESPGAAVAALLAASAERSVNVRSYDPAQPESRPFHYGLRDPEAATDTVAQLAADGLHTIVNETVDVGDGGVSGVALGDVVEFAPGDTPRAVQKGDAAALPRALAWQLFEIVYGFRPGFNEPADRRVEFSLHPLRRGLQHEHTIVWELDTSAVVPSAPPITWPNAFSRFVGDKVYGLLVAHLLGLPVPTTLAVPRRLAPFRFGRTTGTGETWLRTCPTVQQPGRFTTAPRWLDPYALMEQEDPDGTAIAAVLGQEGVDARWSGALVTTPAGRPLLEGVSGLGDAFMVGERSPEALPTAVRAAVLRVYRRASKRLGPVRMEWAYDGRRVWVLQLHVGRSVSDAHVIVPGDAVRFRRFAVGDGVEALRALAADARAAGDGVVLVGRVGVTSHFGDILRRAGVPSRIESA